MLHYILIAVFVASPMQGTQIVSPGFAFAEFDDKGSTPIARTLSRRPILAKRSVHVEAKEVQCGVQARCC